MLMPFKASDPTNRVKGILRFFCLWDCVGDLFFFSVHHVLDLSMGGFLSILNLNLNLKVRQAYPNG